MKTDVCIITEGTYPYVFGGVSSWIHNLLKSMPGLTFSLVNISSTGDTLRTAKYEIPSNILEFKEIFVHDFVETKNRNGGSQKEAWHTLRNFYKGIENSNISGFQDVYAQIVGADFYINLVRLR